VRALTFVRGRVLTQRAFSISTPCWSKVSAIVAVVEERDPQLRGIPRHDLKGQLLLPGFIDVAMATRVPASFLGPVARSRGNCARLAC